MVSVEYLEELKKLLVAYPDEVDVCYPTPLLAFQTCPATFLVHNSAAAEVGL